MLVCLSYFFLSRVEVYRGGEYLLLRERDSRCRLRVICKDQPGIIKSVSEFLFLHDANIVESNQYTSEDDNLFFMRIEFEIPSVGSLIYRLRSEFAEIADRFVMDYHFELSNRRKQLVIFVSREEHCLRELLWQWEIGHLHADIRMVISNHDDARFLVESLGIPFHYLPVRPDTKAMIEEKQLNLIGKQVDFIVLARYMQILSPHFLAAFPNRIINIHHSFLPAFVGCNPYEQAYHRGVKLIGATAHYVTEELDEGPIIEQQVLRVSHRDSVHDLKRIGQNVERSTLFQAVKWHVEDRILVHRNKTIVLV
ncbi:formyltetrahydrofolate deformylase [Alicyclobacillus tolerans]|uniref:formyltetrahydrofolate deformylase n=1 Tax=Alicyclobacillus tolerans TaxID=90970 RepID=UPI003B795540